MTDGLVQYNIDKRPRILEVLVLRPQFLVLVFGPQSPWNLQRTLNFANSLLRMITWSP